VLINNKKCIPQKTIQGGRKMKRHFVLGFVVMMSMVIPAFGQQSDYPSRQIEYVVPAGAGGGTDTIARVIAEFAGKKLKQSVMVVNKTGGGGVVGTSYALKQNKADGYTILAETHSWSSMLVAGMENPPVTLEDRIFIARFVVDPLVFAVNADAPWKTLKEFGEWVKANPDKLTWGSTGPAAISAFAVQEWLSIIGVDHSKTNMVPIKGAADAVTKLAGGHIMLAVHTVGECYSLYRGGKIRILAMAAEKRSKYLPDIPTAAEQGIKGSGIIWWSGMSIRKGTADSIVKKWIKLSEDMVKDPEFQKKIALINSELHYLNSEDLTRFAYGEVKNYRELAKRIGIRQ
jgi:tripartite-type tricarboxylate transporter receptor subunit TctC